MLDGEKGIDGGQEEEDDEEEEEEDDDHTRSSMAGMCMLPLYIFRHFHGSPSS
jgi:hypothetical protein